MVGARTVHVARGPTGLQRGNGFVCNGCLGQPVPSTAGDRSFDGRGVPLRWLAPGRKRAPTVSAGTAMALSEALQCIKESPDPPHMGTVCRMSCGALPQQNTVILHTSVMPCVRSMREGSTHTHTKLTSQAQKFPT